MLNLDPYNNFSPIIQRSIMHISCDMYRKTDLVV